MIRCLLLLCIVFTGCARLPAGDLQKFSKPVPPQVILIRGFLDWYSTGIDQLASHLLADGVSAQVYREDQWRDIAAALRQSPHAKLVLIGFSYGADDAILITRQLNDRHCPVDLLITIDPVTPATIPANVKRSINFYEPNGVLDIFPWLRGVPVHAATGNRVENINIRQRSDLNEPNTSHATIAGNPKLQEQIRNLCRRLGQPEAVIVMPTNPQTAVARW